MINLKNIRSNLLKVDKRHYKGINIYYIEYIAIKKIDDCESTYIVNPLYLLVNHTSGHAEEENGNKYLIFDDSINKNKGLLKRYADVWDGIKSEIKAINGGEENNYGKDYIKIKVNSDDDLPLNKPLKFHAMTINIRSVLKKGVNCIHKFSQMMLCMNYKNATIRKISISEGIDTNKTVLQKNACFVIIGTLKMLDLNLHDMFVINVIMF